MVTKPERQWYGVYWLGDSEPTWFVSALSIDSVYKHLSVTDKVCRVVPAKVWMLAKMLSGRPIMLPSIKDIAPNFWDMVTEGHTVKVGILD